MHKNKLLRNILQRDRSNGTESYGTPDKMFWNALKLFILTFSFRSFKHKSRKVQGKIPKYITTATVKKISSIVF